MEERKLVPFSFYLPKDQHIKLKELAKERKASTLVRDAIAMLLEGSNDQFLAGYNQGVRDAAKVVYDCKEAQMVAVKGRDVGAILADQINELSKTR
jgi:predicted DNA-binding protein